MKKYTQPTAKVVELSVKESLSLRPAAKTRTFGFGSYKATASVSQFATNAASALKIQG